MNQPKCDDFDYIQFPIASKKVFTCTKLQDASKKGKKSKPKIPLPDCFQDSF